MNPLVGILTGPTASGKTQLALQWAAELSNIETDIEIINADSLLVYRGLDIRTAKPTPAQLNLLPHHLIDLLDPSEAFTAGDFCRAAHAAIADIHRRGKRALIIGGTGFYLKALLFGLWEANLPIQNAELKAQLQLCSNPSLYEELCQKDLPSAERIGPHDRYRLIRAIEICRLSGKSLTELQASLPKSPDPQFRLWIIDRETSELHARIQLRTQEMLNHGVIEEFKTMNSRYPESRALMAVGYAQINAYLKEIPPVGRNLKPGIEGLSEEIQLATRQLVKRQRTWFKGQCKPSNNAHGFRLFKLDAEMDLLKAEFQKIYMC